MRELIQLLHDCGDQDDSIDINLNNENEVGNLSFADLGFDSLSIFNVIVAIEKRRKIQVPYDTFVNTRTPQALLTVINDAIKSSAIG